MKLPVDYTKLTREEKRTVREQYIALQKGKCYYCRHDLSKPVPEKIADKEIDWSLFPENFLKYPIHLQHNHETGMTEGAVHAYCNAVMWQYEGL
jgi:hypothetical protein